MIVCVTGATGFVGGHVVRALARVGYGVRVTYRDKAGLSPLRDFVDEARTADVLDPDALRAAFRGADAVCHTAGVVGSSERAWRVNALAPRLIVEAAAEADVGRILYTSSVVAIGPSPPGMLGTEESLYRGGALGLTYLDSKHEGEVQAVAAALRRRAELVIVNPAYVLGVPVARTRPPQSSARRIVDFLAGRMRAMVDAPTNVVDVQDVAEGHVLALAGGRPGERYILGGHNAMWGEIVEQIQLISGDRRPVLMVPRALARAARFQDVLGLPGWFTGGLLTRLAAPNWQFSSEKAEQELGYRPRPLRETLEEALDWFTELRDGGLIADVGEGGPPALRLAERAGVFRALRTVSRASGKRLVVGD